MAAENFERSLKLVLQHEGKFSNDPQDPGGVTMEGIIQRVYDAYRDSKNLDRRPLRPSMYGRQDWIQERDEIYRKNYWNKVRADDLPSGIDYAVFDGAVNSGPYQASKWLQRALGVEGDGIIGPITLKAAKEADPTAIIAKLSDNRLDMLKRLRTWERFGRGWSTRVADVERTAKEWA